MGEVFTDIAFEHNPALLPVATRRAYVCAFSGALYQVNLDMRVIEAVHQVRQRPGGWGGFGEGMCLQEGGFEPKCARCVHGELVQDEASCGAAVRDTAHAAPGWWGC